MRSTYSARRLSIGSVTRRLLTIAIVCCCLPGGGLETCAADQEVGQEKKPGRRVAYAPGVVIDFAELVVEVEAKVVLRQGPLELLVCSPRTREHESIFTVSAKPSQIFQAMGLVGLEPGTPVRYDREAKRWYPATGASLKIAARYELDGRLRTESVDDWLLDLRRRQPVDSVNWVFAGSRVYPDGRFGADAEGTIACVVDFDTALISVGALHTADNAALWLGANAEKIPPVGTSCTLLIRAAGPLTVDVSSDGTLKFEDRPMSPQQLVEKVRIACETDGRARVVLKAASATPEALLAELSRKLKQAGGDRVEIRIDRHKDNKDQT